MWVPHHNHSRGSQLDGMSKSKDIAKKCIEYGFPGAAITEHGNISSSIEFSEAMIKSGLKPILGCELYLSKYDASIKEQTNRKCSHL